MSPTIDSNEWVSGQVKKWFDQKGFGFVALDGSGKDVFLHKTKIKPHLRSGVDIGVRVEIRVEDTDKGLRALALRYPG